VPALKHWTISDFLANAAREYGDRPAVTYSRVTWTYQDLERITDQLAAGLLAVGVKQKTHVALLVEPGLYSLAMFYAVQKIGAVAVMICTTLTPEEFAFQLELSDAEYLAFNRSNHRGVDLPGLVRQGLSKDHQLKGIFHLGQEALDGYESCSWLIRQGERISAEELAAAKAAVRPEDTAGILFTSGTTSKPKAVMISHASRVNNGFQEAEAMECTPEDRFCVSLPMYHCFCISTILLSAVAAGSCVCIPRSRHSRDLLATVSEQRCTIFSNVPTLFHALVTRTDLQEFDFSSLRCGLIAGSTYSQELFRRVEKILGYTLLCGLGQTECTGGITSGSLSDSEELRSSTVGRLFEHVEGKIISIGEKDGVPAGTALPTGEKGEFCVRGYLLMQGYYKQPELTEKTIDAEGWLHTGDQAYFDENGYLHLTGRIKDLIIRGGENIAPAEIEGAVGEIPGVKECKVLGVPDDHYGEEICACIMPSRSANLTAESVVEALKPTLASFKLPRYVLFFDDFPRTSTGKVRPSALKEEAIARLNLPAK
jgi:fatty-acyl-CoA synthase